MTVLPPLRWAVLVVDPEPSIGHGQGGERRSLVVSEIHSVLTFTTLLFRPQYKRVHSRHAVLYVEIGETDRQRGGRLPVSSTTDRSG